MLLLILSLSLIYFSHFIQRMRKILWVSFCWDMVGLKGTHFNIELLLTSSGFDEVSPFCFLKNCYLPSFFLSTISNREGKKIFLFCFVWLFQLNPICSLYLRRQIVGLNTCYSNWWNIPPLHYLPISFPSVPICTTFLLANSCHFLQKALLYVPTMHLFISG